MGKILFLSFFLCCGVLNNAFAQSATLNNAKYIATLKVVAEHKLNDKDITSDLEKLRQSKKFKQDLNKMIEKLDNSRPSEAKNRKVMQILERAGREIYNELK